MPTSHLLAQTNILQQHACPSLRVLELFAGIGGLAAVWPEAEIVAAVDINEQAAKIYRQNFPHRYIVQEITSLSREKLNSFQADFWWLSPPCQPFSRRGKQHDLDDPRSGGLRRITQAVAACLPAAIGLENVSGFVGSRAMELFMQQLEDCGYHLLTAELCPTQLGWPNRRPRFYLLAAQRALGPWQALPGYQIELGDLLDQDLVPGSAEAQSLLLPQEKLDKYFTALDRVDPAAQGSVAACFGASYGKSLLRAGSYVRCGEGYRWMSPNEMARLLGFSERFSLAGMHRRGAWKLLGNSLSLPVVRYVLSHLAQASSLCYVRTR